MKLGPRIMLAVSLISCLPMCFFIINSSKDTVHVNAESPPSQLEKVEEVEDEHYATDYLEPLVTEDFPAGLRKEPVIPHIIHQTYKDESIPSTVAKYVKSIQEKNPGWKYYFWTDSSARKLVAERYPHLLEIWDGYISPINRADVIRYIVLHEFGGFYGDLDVECIRSLDRLTYKYACIFPPEPFEQAVFRLKAPYLINNAIMMCRKGHPFLRYMIDSLHEYQHMIGLIDIAGPSFVTSMFIRYNNISIAQFYQTKLGNDSNSPYFYKGILPENDNNAVYVPNTKYFINSLSQDWMNEKHYKKICDASGNKRDVERRACNELYSRLKPNNRSNYAFTDHHWEMSYNDEKQKKIKQKTFQPLKTVIADYVIY